MRMDGKTAMLSQSPVSCGNVTMLFEIHADSDVSVGFSKSRDAVDVANWVNFTKKGKHRIRSRKGAMTFTCRFDGIRLKGPFSEHHYVLDMLHQQDVPDGRVLPCWTVRHGSNG